MPNFEPGDLVACEVSISTTKKALGVGVVEYLQKDKCFVNFFEPRLAGYFDKDKLTRLTPIKIYKLINHARRD